MHIDDDLADTAFHIVGTDPTHGYETWLDAWHRCAAGDAFSHPDYLATLAAEGRRRWPPSSTTAPARMSSMPSSCARSPTMPAGVR
ncbi:hypothetical protein IOD13_15110 [Brevibacterium casei]|nr:hypothetical protein [Brevibacterium casei]